MSGCGSLSYFLQQSRIDIKATDDFSFPSSWDSYWTDIENIDCLDAIVKYGKETDVIVLSWPSVRDITYHCLNLMRMVNPDCMMVVIIAEEYTNPLFAETLKVVDNELISKANDNYIGWYNDKIMLVR